LRYAGLRGPRLAELDFRQLAAELVGAAN
jgi:hypothetical protein